MFTGFVIMRPGGQKNQSPKRPSWYIEIYYDVIDVRDHNKGALSTQLWMAGSQKTNKHHLVNSQAVISLS